MALTMAEYAKQAYEDGNLLLGNIADWTIMRSNVLQMAPWATNPQLAVQITAWESFPTVGTRKINTAFDESTGKTEQKIESKYIFGHYIDVDTVLADAGPTLGDVRQNQRKAAAKAMAYKFNDMFINGNPADDEFKGIKSRVDDVSADGFTDQLINAGSETTANRGMLYDTTERHYFMDKVAELIFVTGEGDPDGLFMNSKMYLAFEAALRRENVLKQTEDMFGRVITVYGNIPLNVMGKISAFSTTEIIPNNETKSDGSEETSIYAVKYGEEEFLWGIQQKPMEVIDHGRLATASVYRDEVQWVCGLAVSNPHGIARAYGFVANNGAS